MKTRWAIIITAVVVGITVGLGTYVLASTKKVEPEFTFYLVDHATADPFHSVIFKGFYDALKLFNCEGEAYYPPAEIGVDVETERRNFMLCMERNPDGIITTLPDPSTLDAAVAEAIERGIPVIAMNTDDPEGAKGNKRLAYVGADLYADGYNAARIGITEYWHTGKRPKPEEINAVMACEEPTAEWSMRRERGMRDFMKEYGVTDIPLVDLGGWDRSTQMRRIESWLAEHPETNCWLTPGTAVAIWRVCEDKGINPDEVTMIAFDLRPETLEGVEKGYIQLTWDQGPYLQGYIPVVQLYLINKYKLGAFDVATGGAYVTKETVGIVKELAKTHYR